MATSSITANFHTDDPKAANIFVRAPFTNEVSSNLPPSLKPYEFKSELEKRAFLMKALRRARACHPAYEVMLDKVSNYGPMFPKDGIWFAISNFVRPWKGTSDHYADNEVDPLRCGALHLLRGGFWVERNGASMKITLRDGVKLPSVGFRICLGPDLVSEWKTKRKK